jgi:hypothetical protein
MIMQRHDQSAIRGIIHSWTLVATLSAGVCSVVMHIHGVVQRCNKSKGKQDEAEALCVPQSFLRLASQYTILLSMQFIAL